MACFWRWAFSLASRIAFSLASAAAAAASSAFTAPSSSSRLSAPLLKALIASASDRFGPPPSSSARSSVLAGRRAGDTEMNALVAERRPTKSSTGLMMVAEFRRPLACKSQASPQQPGELGCGPSCRAVSQIDAD